VAPAGVVRRGRPRISLACSSRPTIRLRWEKSQRSNLNALALCLDVSPSRSTRHRLARRSPPGRLGGSSEAARLGSIRQRKGEDQRPPGTIVAPTVPLRRYLGAGTADHRCVRAEVLHCGAPDWTRTIGMLTYEQGRRAVSATPNACPRVTRAALMGGTFAESLQLGSATVPFARKRFQRNTEVRLCVHDDLSVGRRPGP